MPGPGADAASVAAASAALTAADAAGHAESYGSVTFGYNNRGRMQSTGGGSTNYLYNALGQMIEKSGTPGTTVFMQDEAGHLIGEYGSTGGLVEETVWLGDIPVATLQPNGSGGVNIFYVHTDHLNTPRKVAQPTSGTLVWRWDADPYGTAAANQNPSGLGTFPYNIRLPGQYYMAETGLNQNLNRDYDPLIGKYIESDPIGLRGGRNTFAYALSNPETNMDATGLLVRGEGLSNPQWAEVQRAESRIRAQAARACSCRSDGSSGSCIPCSLIPDLLDYLDRSVVHYQQSLGPHICAQAPNVFPYMRLAEIAFDPDSCDCLASTIYHELLHNIGWNHTQDPARDPVNAAEQKCKGDLCGNGVVEAIIVH